MYVLPLLHVAAFWRVTRTGNYFAHCQPHDICSFGKTAKRYHTLTKMEEILYNGQESKMV
jgi:hypothetical protein